MSNPRLRIDLEKIKHNTIKTIEIARLLGVQVAGVTKGVAGMPEVAGAMLAGGLESLADSRLDNIARLRAAGVRVPITLIRSPGPSDISRTVELADASHFSDVEIAGALSIEARLRNKIHGAVLMVDLHTGREGLPADLVPAACLRLNSMDGIRFQGLGAYFHLATGSENHLQGLQTLVSLAKKVGADLGRPVPVISAGASNIFRTFAVEGRPNPGFNHLRIGTAILLGFSSSLNPVAIPGYERDTFQLLAEVIEVKAGKAGEAILALGKVEADPAFLFPASPGVTVRDASSDHLMIRTERPVRVGDWVPFRLGYPALCRLTASPYVKVEHTSIRS